MRVCEASFFLSFFLTSLWGVCLSVCLFVCLLVYGVYGSVAGDADDSHPLLRFYGEA